MKIKNIQPVNELKIKDIEGFLKSKVTWYGTGAKVDCLKRYLGQEVYLVILKNGNKKEDEGNRGNIRKSSPKNRRARQDNKRATK